jgi:hypothetical protein
MAVVVAAAITAGSWLSAAEDVKCNCVLYARSKVPSLPRGLDTHVAKLGVINSNVPRVGVVAVHSYNHVSVVTRVWTVRVRVGRGYRTDTYVKINEANYRRCQITSRSGSPQGLGIVGYFDPAKR